MTGQQVCEDAISINNIPFNSGILTTCEKGNSRKITCGDFTALDFDGEDIVYKIKITNAPISYNLALYGNPESEDVLPYVSLYQGCPEEDICILGTFFILNVSDLDNPIEFGENGDYYFVFDAYPTGCYEFSFQILEEGQVLENNCTNAINLGEIESPYYGNTTLYSNDFQQDCLSSAPDQVFYIDIPNGVSLNIGQTDTDYDTQFRVAYGDNCPGTELIVCQDDPDLQSYDWLNITGRTQRVWWTQDGYSGASGQFILEWQTSQPAENVMCEEATEIGCGQTITGRTSQSVVNEVPFCGTSLNTAKGVWHQFMGNGGSVTLDLCGTTYDSKLGIFEGTCNNLICVVGEDDDGNCSLNETITFQTIASKTYYVLVTGYESSEGDYQLSLNCDITTTRNLAVTSLFTPQSACNLGANETVTTTIENLGTATQSNFEVGVKVDNITLFRETVNTTLQAGESLEYTFNRTINLSEEKEYTIEVFTDLFNDQEPENDALIVTVQHLSGLEGTTLEVSEETICSGDWVSLQANGGTNYQWSNTDLRGSFVFDYPETTTNYSVTITDDLGCEAIQTTTVEVNPLPAQPIINASAEFLCPESEITLQTIPGNITWSTGENTSSITVRQGGFYDVTITSDEGCSRSAGGIFIREVNPPTVSVTNDGVICEGETATLRVNDFSATYNWSTGESTRQIRVTPLSTESYTVTITNDGCKFIEEVTVAVQPDLPAGKVSNMLPPNGASGLDIPVNFSWSPGENAASYDLYVGLENEELTYVRTTSEIQASYSNLRFGNTYCWQVVSRSCSGVEGEASTIQCFALEFLPDLVVRDINTPTTTAFAGTEIVVNWQYLNNGRGPTRTNRWWDNIYLSTDTEWDSGDIYLDYSIFEGFLEEGETATNSAKINLPVCETGEYYLIIRTDAYRNVQEEEETNNVGVSAIPILIQTAPLPDLRITGTPQLDVAGVVQAGESYQLNWQLSNQGTLATPVGFYHRIFISEESFYSPITARFLANPFYSENILQNTATSLSEEITIPANLADGEYYIHILTDASDRIEECDFEGNNVATTTSFSVLEIPKPNFVVNSIEILAESASNKEAVTLRWEVANLEAPYTGDLFDQITISANSDGSSVVYRTSLRETVTIESESSIIREKTFNVPDNITGQFYVQVITNRFGSVAETSLMDNTSSLDSFQVISPDLSPRNLSALTTIAAGQRLTATWLLENVGTGDLLNSYVQENLYLSTNEELDFNDDHYLGREAGNVTILSNNSLARSLDISIPDDAVTGDYFLILLTNPNERIYENGQTTDNLLSIPITITEGIFPDLVAESINMAINETIGGSQINLNSMITNLGAAATSESWRDVLYYCTCASWNPNEVRFLAADFRSQILSENSSYTNDFNIRLPFTLPTGDYYFYLKTDNDNAIFEEDESDESNIARSTVLSVTAYQNVDLAIRGVNPPSSIIPGQSANVYFETRNVGETATFAENWLDGVVLSDDLVWDPTVDTIVIAQWPHNGNLTRGQQYAVQESFTLPTVFTGQKYILLVTDLTNSNNESNLSNNAVILPPSGGEMGNNDPVTFPPKSDLTIEIQSASSIAIAGQPLRLQCEVTNTSTEAVAMGSWRDGAAITTNDNIFPNRALGYLDAPVTSLDAGTSYNTELVFDIPITAAGNNFIVVKTDATNNLQEELENNNLSSQYLRIIQPPPADLVVREINALPLDTIATDMTVAWTVRNVGFNPAEGQMVQGVYLSKNDTWEVNDVLLGTSIDFITLNPNQEAIFELTGRIEGVERGDYFVIIRTDLRNNILENIDTNNISSSIATTFIEVSEIIVDAPATNADFELQQPLFYRMEIMEELAGAAIRVTLGSSDLTAFNELYVSLDTMPTRTTYDFGFDQAFSPNQEIVLPNVDEGTYYILAYPVEGIAIQNINLQATIIPYEITNIESNEGGNTGQVTVKLSGGKFDPTMSISLQKEDTPPINAETLYFINSTEAYVTFNLEGVDVGIYDVKGLNNLGEEAILANGFKIVTGTIANNLSSLDMSCTVNTGGQVQAFTVNVADELIPLELEKIHPAQVRPGQTIKVQIRFRNNGNVDLPIPERILGSQNGYPISRTETNFGQNEKGIHLLFPYEDGQQSFPFIPPGQSVIQEVFVKAEGGVGDVIKLRLFEL